jgi:hypothetical protein
MHGFSQKVDIYKRLCLKVKILMLLSLIAIAVGGCVYYPIDGQYWVGEREDIFYDVTLVFHISSTKLGFAKSGPPYSLHFKANGQEEHKYLTVHSIIITSSDGHRYVFHDVADSTKIFNKNTYTHLSETEASNNRRSWPYSTIHFGEKNDKGGYNAASTLKMDIESKEGRSLILTADLTVVMNDGKRHRGIFEETFTFKHDKEWIWMTFLLD